MNNTTEYKDWGEVSEIYDELRAIAKNKDLSKESEAQTRFDLLDRFIKEVLQFNHGNILVEPYTTSENTTGYIDYILKSGDYSILIEAKKLGAAFPNPTKKKKLKLSGSILGEGEIHKAILQADSYAENEDCDIVIVTNGNCWCYYSRIVKNKLDEIYASIFFPFESVKDAEDLFMTFAVHNIENGNLEKISNHKVSITNSLSKTLKDSDARIDRNKIADYISSALDNAINGEAILNDEQRLKYCFVHTDARTKYDSSLEIYLADKKPVVVMPARRVKKDRSEDELSKSLSIIEKSTYQPVTLLIGAVGAGKSTYLSHFEKIHAKTLLAEKKCFWVYIDFEKLGTEDPKTFIYNTLKNFSLEKHPNVNTDFENLIAPAYAKDFENLSRGPFSLASKDVEKFEIEKQEIIKKDFYDVHPYVEKIYSYLSSKNLCVIVLDNIDLFEKDKLEIEVLSEGIALSKKINSAIFISIRDTTFIKHKNDSIFNAHELKKFWIDPPPLREVLSKRLKLAGEILKGKKAEIVTHNGMKLNIQDLSIFFEIAHTSLLNETQARFVECIADGNIRKGIALVTNFLISGHIQIERQIVNYISKQTYNKIPFHEVFKGCVQGLWKNYVESKAEIINLLNSNLGSLQLQLLRIYVLKYLKLKAKDKNTLETSVKEIGETFSVIGATSDNVNSVLTDLLSNKLIGSESGETVSSSSITVHINLSGAYYYEFLYKTVDYIEAVIYDTPIFLDEIWNEIYDLTIKINNEHHSLPKLYLRKDKLNCVIQYVQEIEEKSKINIFLTDLAVSKELKESLDGQINEIIKRQEFYHQKSNVNRRT